MGGKGRGGRGEALGTLGSRRDGRRWAVHGGQGDGGGGKRRRGCSGEDWARGGGRLASWRRGKANGGVGVGGEAAVRRLRGEGELAGVAGGAAACSVAWERGANERTSGI